jgi:hypothetical protein
MKKRNRLGRTSQKGIDYYGNGKGKKGENELKARQQALFNRGVNLQREIKNQSGTSGGCGHCAVSPLAKGF